MRAILIGAAALLLSACSTGDLCRPLHVSSGHVEIDAAGFMTRHPGSELCLSPISCSTDLETFLRVDSADTVHLDITVRTDAGQVLLHATPSVRISFEPVARGCDNGTYSGWVTIDPDGKVSSS